MKRHDTNNVCQLLLCLSPLLFHRQMWEYSLSIGKTLILACTSFWSQCIVTLHLYQRGTSIYHWCKGLGHSRQWGYNKVWGGHWWGNNHTTLWRDSWLGYKFCSPALWTTARGYNNSRARTLEGCDLPLKDDKQGLTRVECRSDLHHCNSFAYWHGNFYSANVHPHLYDCVYYVTRYQNQALLHELVISTSLPNILWVCQML